MRPQDEFENWYREAMGITIEEAKRRGVWDIETLRSAFFAGISIGTASFGAKVTGFWKTAISEEKKLQERFNNGN